MKKLLLLPLLSCLLFSCQKEKEVVQFDEAFSPYISAYTSGVISAHNKVTVRFTANVVDDEKVGEPYDGPLFEFSPSLDGKAIWASKNTVKYIPSSPMNQDEMYDVHFALREVMQVPDSLSTFRFQFRTKQQQVSFEDGMLLSAGHDELAYRSALVTADKAKAEQVEEVVEATYQGEKLPIEWTHEEDGLVHSFKVTNIKKQDQSSQLRLTWDGSVLKAQDEGEKLVDIPASGVFELGDVVVNNERNQFISLVFSDPIDPTQTLEGLVDLQNAGNYRLTTEDNRIIIYPSSRLSGTYKLVVNQGIQNTSGEKLPKTVVREVLMEELKPDVRLVGNGVIIPQSDQLTFPFEAVNLQAVDVSIAKIYESNVLQFLQENNLGGERNLYRTADVIKRKRVSLNPDNSGAIKRWSRYGINLKEIVEPEPGAIYYVNLSFRPEYSAYSCTNADFEKEEGLTELKQAEDIRQPGRWNLYSDYDFEYDWRHRDDPCHRAYYRQHRFVQRNVLASNIGLIGKYTNDNILQVTATDLLDASPANNVELEVYDYRMQQLTATTTDQEGMAKLKMKKYPYFVIAKNGKERGYLRLAPGESLSMSKFDTDGVSPEKGLKGMIYGEREVWRPGDSIYLTFVLRDPNNHLPANYPVNLTFTNPRGQVVEKVVQTPGAGRFYNFHLATDADAPTGNYTVTAKAGGITVRENIKVETIKPNRLKVDLQPETTPITADNASVRFDLSSQWLHGADASGLKYKVELSLRHTNTTFDGFPDYEFDDQSYPFSAEPRVLSEGNLDKEGKASFSANLLPNQRAPGKLKAAFKSRVFEQSGNFSVSPFSTDFYPYESFVGLRIPEGNRWTGGLNVDSTHNVSVAVVDKDGKPVKNKEVKVRLYKLEWRWWWQRSDENVAAYVKNNYAKPLQEAVVTTNSNGKAVWPLRVKDQEWGRYLIWAEDESGGHRAGTIVRMDHPRYAGLGRGGSADEAAMLPLSTDKDDYEVGETATVTLPASQGGRALVTLESGSTILRSFWVTPEEGVDNLSIEVETTPDMVPNIYATVMMLQPHAQTQNDLPIRLYGVVPINVEDPATHLEPTIATSESFRPNSTASITVGEKEDRDMTYTLAVVDEGLLGLTNFQTPNPWDHFFAKEALGVQTWDLFNEVLGAQGGQMEQMLSIGGGMADAEVSPDKEKANRFKPMVRFLGPFELDKGEQQTHEVDIPQYVGAVRIMVVAGNDKAYGNAEETVEVKKPLMVLSTVPRVLGPGEEARIPVEVFAMEDHVEDVTVNFATNELFEIQGSPIQKVHFDRPGSKLAFFEVKVHEQVGIGKLSVNASSGNEKATEEVEVQVRHPNAALNEYVTMQLNERMDASFDYKPIGIKGTNEARLEISTLPPMNLGGRLDFLIRYPYGCLEQTTSSLFPQLFLSDVVKLDEEEQEQINDHVEVGIKKLTRFQHANGGLRYWPGRGSADDWSTSYAGHLMIEAKKKGYRVPYGFFESWTNYQTSQASNWNYQAQNDSWRNKRSQYAQAYRLFTLALHGKPAMGAMNRMKQMDDLYKGAQWRLATSYALIGQQEVAQELIRGLDVNFADYRDYSYTYGSSLRDKAMALETLVIMGETNRAQELMEEITNVLAKDKWLGTQTTAYCLLAISKYAQQSGKGLDFSYSVSNGPSGEVTDDLPMWQKEVPANYNQEEKVELSNNMEIPLYARVILTGKPPVGGEQASSSNINLDVKYYDMEGNRLDVSRLEQGTDFLASVTIGYDGRGWNYDQMALTQIFPSGWEIINTRMDNLSYEVKDQDEPEYQNIRDDRVYTYFDLGYRQSKRFVIPLTATYAGRYYLPAVKAEAMYDNEIHANSTGQWVEVLMPGRTQ